MTATCSICKRVATEITAGAVASYRDGCEHVRIEAVNGEIRVRFERERK